MTNLKAGWYGIWWTLGWLAHSFVGTDNNPEVWFDCYGGHTDTYQRVFPAISEPGNLTYARAICNLQPHSTKTEFNGWFDSCGIIYGVSGVCHQMTNRVLWATNNHKILMNQPGYMLSWVIYGHYGDVLIPAPGFLLARAFLDEIIRIMGISPTLNLNWLTWLNLVDSAMKKANFTEPLPSFEEFVNSQNDELLKLELINEYTPDLPVQRLEGLLARNSAFTIGTNDKDAMIGALRNMVELKQEHDSKMLSCSITKEQYCEAVNTGFQNMVGVFSDTLSKDEFKQLFNQDAATKYNLVDPSMMANIPWK